MGDLNEFTYWPQHQYIFYKITSGAMAFSVRGEPHAAVGLTREPGLDCEYWIVIGHNQCWLEKDAIRIQVKDMTNLLSSQVFNKFWVTCHSSQLQFGKTSDGVPLISKKLLSKDAQYYITFSVYNDEGTSQWKLYLPPKLEKRPFKKVSGGEPKWKNAEDQLPDGAYIGGYENEILYIIRSSHRGSLTPGKFVPSLGLGFIPWGGEMHEKSNFEVLCGYNFIWVATSDNRIPLGAVEGGYSEDNMETLYIGRAVEEGHLIPGKVQPSHSVCYIPYNEREIAKTNYEILVDPQSTKHSPNRFIAPPMPNLAEDRPIQQDLDAYRQRVYMEEYEYNTESD